MKEYLEYVEFQARACWHDAPLDDVISRPLDDVDDETGEPHFFAVYGTKLDGSQVFHFDLECETQAQELAIALNQLLAMHTAIRICRNAFDYITRALNHGHTDVAQAHAITAIAVTESQLDAFDR